MPTTREEREKKAFPHGPNEPCTCEGCWACKGHEMNCTCDIEWDWDN
jgi:hypothetical protein